MFTLCRERMTAVSGKLQAAQDDFTEAESQLPHFFPLPVTTAENRMARNFLPQKATAFFKDKADAAETMKISAAQTNRKISNLLEFIDSVIDLDTSDAINTIIEDKIKELVARCEKIGDNMNLESALLNKNLM